MSASRLLPARCMCGWTGLLTSKAPCPACQRDRTYRITPARETVLRALQRGEQPPIVPVVRNWLCWKQLIVPITPRLEPNPAVRQQGKRRQFALTPAGQRAIEKDNDNAPSGDKGTRMPTTGPNEPITSPSEADEEEAATTISTLRAEITTLRSLAAAAIRWREVLADDTEEGIELLDQATDALVAAVDAYHPGTL